MDPVLHFPTKYTAAETAQILGVSVATLARERRRGRITPYLPGDKRVYYFDHEIAAYQNRRTLPWDERSSSPAVSATTGSQGNMDRHSGTERGSIEALDKRDAKASALKILSAPTSCSRSGSPSTLSCDVPNRKT